MEVGLNANHMQAGLGVCRPNGSVKPQHSAGTGVGFLSRCEDKSGANLSTDNSGQQAVFDHAVSRAVSRASRLL